MQAESSPTLDAKAQEDRSDSLVPKPNVGFGKAQWTDPGRQQRLIEYARTHNTPVYDDQLQLQFIPYELTNHYSKTLEALKKSTTVADATTIFMHQYERPANSDPTKRIEYATNILKNSQH